MPWTYHQFSRSTPRSAARACSVVQLYFLVFLDFLSLEAFVEGFFLFEGTTTGVSCSLSSFSSPPSPPSSDSGSDLTRRLVLGFGLAFGLQFLELQWEGWAWGNMVWKSPRGKDQSNTRFGRLQRVMQELNFMSFWVATTYCLTRASFSDLIHAR